MRQEQRYRNELRVAVQTSIGNTDQLMGLGPLFPDIPVARQLRRPAKQHLPEMDMDKPSYKMESMMKTRLLNYINTTLMAWNVAREI